MNPLGNFDTLTLVAKQTKDKDVLVTDMRVEAVAPDKAQAQQSAATLRGLLQTAVTQGRHEARQRRPSNKPISRLRWKASRWTADDTKVSITGTLGSEHADRGVFDGDERGGGDGGTATASAGETGACEIETIETLKERLRA